MKTTFISPLSTPKSTGITAITICLTLACLAIAAPLLSPYNYYTDVDITAIFLKPFEQGHIFGTDEFGRDTFSGVLYGLRTSFIIGAGASFIAMLIGSFLGLFAAHKGGLADLIVRRLLEIQLSIPSFLLALIFVAIWGQGIWPLFLALVVTQWAYFAQTTRAIAKVEVKKEYIALAQLLPHSLYHILIRHLWPNSMPAITAVFTAQFARGVGIEAALSFLGAGLPITEPSLGIFIAEGYGYFLSKAYWLCLFPSLALITLVMSLTISADYLAPQNRRWRS